MSTEILDQDDHINKHMFILSLFYSNLNLKTKGNILAYTQTHIYLKLVMIYEMNYSKWTRNSGGTAERQKIELRQH
jgi:hypothetical protein